MRGAPTRFFHDREFLPEPLDERGGRGLRIMRSHATPVVASLSIGCDEAATAVRCIFSEEDHHAEQAESRR